MRNWGGGLFFAKKKKSSFWERGNLGIYLAFFKGAVELRFYAESVGRAYG